MRPPLRSLLYVPASRQDLFDKAVASQADGVILDLEDAVAADQKGHARRQVCRYLERCSDGPAFFVRVNSCGSPWFSEDVGAVIAAGASGIVLPKVRGVSEVLLADELMGTAEKSNGQRADSVVLLPLLETTKAIYQAFEVTSAAPRIDYAGGIVTRGGDVSRAVGYPWRSDGDELGHLRAHVLLAVRAAGVLNPMTGVWAGIDDLAGFEHFARSARLMGYTGIAVIHPRHVPIANKVFGVDEADLVEAANVLTHMARTATSDGAAQSVGGRMIDVAMIRTAESLLQRAGRLSDDMSLLSEHLTGGRGPE